jgi:hypothetical protein
MGKKVIVLFIALCACNALFGAEITPAAVLASSEVNSNSAAKAIDKNTGTRWESATSDPQWIRLDFGSSRSIARVVTDWEVANAKAYTIQTSNDAASWTTVSTLTNMAVFGNHRIDDIAVTASGRYLRLYGTARNTNYAYSIWEIHVYDAGGSATSTPTAASATSTPTLPPATINLALNKTATASSVEGGYTANLTVDGNAGTRWASAWSDPQWLMVDLGSPSVLSRVVLRWEAAYARAFQIQVSPDGSAWTAVYTTTAGTGGVNDLAVSGTGRYIRMYATARATGYGYSLWELEAYGSGGGATATPTKTPTPTVAGATATPTKTATNSPTSASTATPTSTVATATFTPGAATNIALNKNAQAWTYESTNTPASAVDGNMATRWASGWTIPQWIFVDFGGTASFTRVTLYWEAAYANAYQLQTSNDGSSWSSIYSTTSGDGGTDDIAVSGTGRFLRIYITAKATQWGNSLFEIQVFGTGGGNAAPISVPTPAIPAYNNLVWSDEFDGTSLNTANWNYEIGAGANNEMQYSRAENVSVSGGLLALTAKAEAYGGKNYTSGRINTQNKIARTYGRVEARVKCPYGKGLWPAFWMLGANFPTVGWPACGEIDIMEHINSENITYGTIHWAVYTDYANFGSPVNVSADQYHVYSVIWDANYIRWYVDGALYSTADVRINDTNEFANPFFIILNLAVGGDWPGAPDGTTPFPSTYYVDYVRWYQ